MFGGKTYVVICGDCPACRVIPSFGGHVRGAPRLERFYDGGAATLPSRVFRYVNEARRQRGYNSGNGDKYEECSQAKVRSVRSHNGRFLRHRFAPKPTSVATTNSLPKRNHVAKEAVSTARQTKTRQRSERTRQTERCSSDEAVALRKNHVVRP